MTHLAPQVHLHLLFKSCHEYRRSFSILQPSIRLWRFLTARSFLPEVATPLPSGRTAEKASQLFRGKSNSCPLGCHQGIHSLSSVSVTWAGVSTSWAIVTYPPLLNKLQFLCVMLKNVFFLLKPAFSNAISSSWFVPIFL